MEKTRTYTRKVLTMAEQGLMTWETIARECLDYLSEDEVCYLASSADWVAPDENKGEGSDNE